jgi:DNA-binding MarR family transcriptional regulator
VFYHSNMQARFPLPTLLSQGLVAFTIEFDNEAERQIPHWTTNRGSSSGARPRLWLTSMTMYQNCMQHVDDKGITVRELERLARTKTNLNGMERWGYVTVEPDPSDKRAKPPQSSWLIRSTSVGRAAKNIWQPLFGVMENRWRERFGNREIDSLRDALCGVIRQIDLDLPDCLPILGYGLYSKGTDYERPSAQTTQQDATLPALLSKVLLAFALEYEREAELSIAIGANVLRLFPGDGAEMLRVKDIPRLSGVSKEAAAVAASFLTKRGYARIESESPTRRTKALRLTAKGQKVRDEYNRLIKAVEERWHSTFGHETIRHLRSSLEPLVGEPNQKSPLFLGLEPYPENWRAAIPQPETLPHFPMVLHRGGYPDGS